MWASASRRRRDFSLPRRVAARKPRHPEERSQAGQSAEQADPRKPGDDPSFRSEAGPDPSTLAFYLRDLAKNVLEWNGGV